MRRLRHMIVISLLVLSFASAARAETEESRAALEDIRKTLGFVPGFFAAFPDEGISGAWSEFKSVQLNPKTALPGKYKELMALAVAAQIPCQYCIYFHTKAAKAQGANDREVKEAVALASVVRHWSTILNGAQTDEALFRKELDQIVAYVKKGGGAAGKAGNVREDIQRTLGIMPTFLRSVPESGLAGAWKELKDLQLAPTAIPNKYKELIGLAVAAQIPCRYCVTFHTTVSTRLLGATELEVQETLAMAALVRHWSTFLNGASIDMATFRKEVDRALGGGGKKTASAR